MAKWYRKAKYRCNGCGKNRPSSKFSSKQFSKKSDVRRCQDCIKIRARAEAVDDRANHTTRCNGCEDLKPKSQFSNGQLKTKADIRRCKDCIETENMLIKRRVTERHSRIRKKAEDLGYKEKWAWEDPIARGIADGKLPNIDYEEYLKMERKRREEEANRPLTWNRPPTQNRLVDWVETATASWCPHCGTRMEGGPGGRRKWFCPSCAQLFDANGNAVN